ncbi:MAG: hypothetical protein AAF409_09490 [Pseudomonadota bacterium]
MAMPALADPPGSSFCIGFGHGDGAIERCVLHLEERCVAGSDHDGCIAEASKAWYEYDVNATEGYVVPLINRSLAQQGSEAMPLAEVANLINAMRTDWSHCAPDDARCYLEAIVGQALGNHEIRSRDQP